MRDRISRQYSKDVVFLPQHVYNAMRAQGISLDALDTKIATAENEVDVVNYLNSKLSNMDIQDIYNTKRLIDKYVLKLPYEHNGKASLFTNLVYGSSTGNYSKNYPLTELISFYTNSSVDINNVINENKDDVVFSVEYTNNIVFVILLDGFSNFITYKNVKFPDWFLSRLTGYMFRKYSEEDVRNTNFFESIVTWFTNNKKY